MFEKADGKKHLVDADRLGQLLHYQGMGLVLLSACQSAAVAGEEAMGADEEAMGSVAARLTQAGIPAVIAMPYSVLIHTTRDLFATFYENLAQNKGIGESLDNARRRLMTNPQRGGSNPHHPEFRRLVCASAVSIGTRSSIIADCNDPP